MFFRWNAHTVVPHTNLPVTPLSLAPKFDPWLGLTTHEFNGIANEILKYLTNRDRIDRQRGPIRLNINLHSRLLEFTSQVGARLVDEESQIDWTRPMRRGSHARKFDQMVYER